MSSQQQPLVESATALETFTRLMRGEIAAVTTYRHVIASLNADAPTDLTTCLRSHEQRAMRLAEHIALAGGVPVSDCGLWDAFARVVESSVALLGARTLYIALEEDEDRTLTEYRAALDKLDASGLTLLRNDLLPEQIRTHGLMEALCRRSP